MTKRTAFFLSDQTGVTAETLGHSLLVQFNGQNFRQVTLPFIDTEDKARAAVERIDASFAEDGIRPIVFSTLVQPQFRQILKSAQGLHLDREGLAHGDLVDVVSETATLRLPMQTLSDLQTGTVALPHGWGHQHARGLSVASKTTGVNVNLLAADGPEAVERISGMVVLTGILVEVVAAEGPADPQSWSGLPGR